MKRKRKESKEKKGLVRIGLIELVDAMVAMTIAIDSLVPPSFRSPFLILSSLKLFYFFCFFCLLSSFFFLHIFILFFLHICILFIFKHDLRLLNTFFLRDFMYYCIRINLMKTYLKFFFCKFSYLY